MSRPGVILRAAIRWWLNLTARTYTRTTCQHCGEHHTNMTRHLWYDHGDEA